MSIKTAPKRIKIAIAIKVHETTNSYLEREDAKKIAASQAKLAETTLVPGFTKIYC
jgi:hypothetical protein